MNSLRISKRVIKKPSYLDQFHLDGNKDVKSPIKEAKITEKRDSAVFEKKKRTISVLQDNEIKAKETKVNQKKRRSSDCTESPESVHIQQNTYRKISKRIIKM